MPNSQGTVPATAGRNRKTVKPIPPTDLWAKIDQALAEVNAQQDVRAEGTFTVGEYLKQYGLTRSPARTRIDKLVAAGKLEKCGRVRDGATLYRIK